MKKSLSIRNLTLVGIIFLAAGMRLIPHIPNFTPIAAMALFGGVQFSKKRLAYLLPLGAMVLSDLILGIFVTKTGWWHNGIPFVYGAIAFTVYLGSRLGKNPSALAIGGGALSSSVFFFLLTNLGVWLTGSLYPKTLEGLGACFVAALPFFRNSLMGDSLYTLALFGGFALAAQRWHLLRRDLVIR